MLIFVRALAQNWCRHIVEASTTRGGLVREAIGITVVTVGRTNQAGHDQDLGES